MNGCEELERDLAFLPIRRDEQRRVARSRALLRYVGPDDARSERDERLEDVLRSSEVAAAWRAAHGAPAGSAGETARRRLRLLAWPFLDRAMAPAQAELDGLAASLNSPERGFHFSVVECRSPEDRKALYARWEDSEARLAELRCHRTLAAVAAARGLGAASLWEFNAALHPEPSEPLCAAYETAAIAPLDDAIVRASRDRRLRCPVPLIHPEHPADSAGAGVLIAHTERFPATGVPVVLRAMGGALGSDPDLDGPGVLHDPESCNLPRPWVTRSRGFVLVGALDGPGALVAALEAFGRMARDTFVARTRGAAAVTAADPAFAVAYGMLFARLLLSSAFRGRFGPRPHDGLDADLRLELALLPRLGWTYLYLALRGREVEGGSPTADGRRALRRALGRPASVEQERAARDCDARGAAVLRGTVLALLLEERLMSRWGRGWFLTGTAGRFLRECWEAEDGQTAESVANVLDLGTIEPTPILDGCRPAR